MKALTVCQPFAELIIRGDKPIENRRWQTAYRGPLLIHAGKSRDWLDRWPEHFDDLVFGAIVGMVTLVDCLPAYQVPERWPQLAGNVHCEGPFCWMLTEPRRLEVPIPCRGYTALFGVPERLLNQVV